MFAFRPTRLLVPGCFRRWRGGVAGGAVCLAAAVLGAETTPLDTVQKSAAEWVKVRLETVRQETDWQNQRPLVEATVAGLTERAQQLDEKRDLLQSKTAKDRDELAALGKTEGAERAALQAAEPRARALTARLVSLRPLLPPRLSAALELPYQSLANPQLNLGEQMQLNVAVLNRCQQFNRNVSCDEELVRVDAGANPRLLEVIYWGLSHGYALDRKAGRAWLGRPGPQGWQWEPRPEAAPAVARLIAVYRDQAEPELVAVPAQLVHPAPARSP